MQIRLLNSQPRGVKQSNQSSQNGLGSAAAPYSHRRAKQFAEPDLLTLSQVNKKQEVGDLTNIKNFIKKQVVKFY